MIKIGCSLFSSRCRSQLETTLIIKSFFKLKKKNHPRNCNDASPGFLSGLFLAAMGPEQIIQRFNKVVVGMGEVTNSKFPIGGEEDYWGLKCEVLLEEALFVLQEIERDGAERSSLGSEPSTRVVMQSVEQHSKPKRCSKKQLFNVGTAILVLD